MKKFIIILVLLFAIPIFQTCFCADLLSWVTGMEFLESDFSGSWHSKQSCGEDETDEPYRWGVDLKEDENGHVAGKIYFHDCPGGGAVTYAVEGQHEEDVTPLMLKGTRVDGRYILYMNSPEVQVFEITKGAAPKPNFSE